MSVATGRLRELAGLFLKLGATAFGGPAAHIGMMEREVVARRGWLSREEFLDLLGATNLLPWPSSTKMSLFVGHARAGLPGLLVAGLAFVLPATAIVLAIAWAYVRFGALPAVPHFLLGIKPVVLAIVAHALATLGRTAVKTRFHLALGLAALAASFFAHELLVLVVAGCLSALAMQMGDSLGRIRGDGGAADASREPHGGGGADPHASSKKSPSLFFPLLSSAALSSSFSLPSLFLVCLKTGAVLFGSGYVLFAYFRADFVERLGWLTNAQLLDAIAVGQFTPGPLLSSATFVGYLLAGGPGALAATAGIFLPAFVLVAACGPFVPRLRRSRRLGAFLDGVNVAALALMAAVTLALARPSLVDAPTTALFLAASAVLAAFRVNAAWLVLAGGALGLALG